MSRRKRGKKGEAEVWGRQLGKRKKYTQTSLKLNKFQEPLVLAKEGGKPHVGYPLGEILSKEIIVFAFKKSDSGNNALNVVKEDKRRNKDRS